jgi:hypothetical protein
MEVITLITSLLGSVLGIMNLARGAMVFVEKKLILYYKNKSEQAEKKNKAKIKENLESQMKTIPKRGQKSENDQLKDGEDED